MQPNYTKLLLRRQNTEGSAMFGKGVKKSFQAPLTDDVELLALRHRVEERSFGRDLTAVLARAVEVQVL